MSPTAVKKKTRRVTCPYCGRKAVALGKKSGNMYPHTDPAISNPCLRRSPN